MKHIALLTAVFLIPTAANARPSGDPTILDASAYVRCAHVNGDRYARVGLTLRQLWDIVKVSCKREAEGIYKRPGYMDLHQEAMSKISDGIEGAWLGLGALKIYKTLPRGKPNPDWHPDGPPPGPND